MIFHPRPSPIAAAMYQLRDLGVDAIILHGPSGCCFRTARLLELDGVRVFTSNIDENAIVFGASENLKRALDYAIEYLKKELKKEKPMIGIVGTCASMIIGEDLWEFVDDDRAIIIPVEVHSGSGDNTIGAIKAMESALKLGIIDEREFERQRFLLKKATEVEKRRGMAKKEYIKPTYDDDINETIKILKDLKEKDGKIACVLNAKKETAYLFAHPLIVLNKYFNCVNIANLDINKGLPKIRRDAKNILNRFKADYITGGLDEYPITGDKAVEILKDLDVDGGGVNILANKAKHHLIYISNLHVGGANILKQDALSIGADLVLPKDAITAKVKFVNCILIATDRELKILATKERLQPFGLKDLAKDFLKFITKQPKNIEIMGVLNSNNDSLSMFGRVDGITDDKTQFNVNGRFVTSNVPQVDKNKQMYATENTRMIDVSGKDDIDGKKIDINYTDKDGNIKRAYITLKDTEWTDGSGNKHFSTFTTIADDGTETIYDIYDNEGNKTPIHDKTTITQELDPETCKLCNKTHTTKGITYKQLNDVIGMLVSGNLPQDSNGDGKYDFTEYKKGKDSSKKVVNVGMENGKIFIEDKQNATTKIKFAINDRDSDSYDGSSPVFKFNSNNGITIDESKVDIFHQLDEIIKSVENGKVRVDGDSKNPRERGIQEGIELIDHLQDHIIKKHTEIGAISKSLQNTEERNNMLIVHVETLKSSVIDVDMAEASLKLQKLTLNYNAMLSTISKVNGLSLVNYMK